MTKSKKIKSTVLASAIAISLTSAVTVSASTADLFTVSPSPIYQAIKKQPLQTALDQVAQRSGIVFKINADIGSDVVSQTLAASNWTAAIKSLLVNYNYTIVTNGGAIKTVIVTGHAGNGSNPTQLTASVEPANYNAPIIISQKMTALPKKYDNYPAGSVLPVSFPVNELMALGKGEVTKLDTPLGQFNVAHDSTVQETSGSQTWVGHLSDEGLGYRVMISQGPAGVMGHVTTPEGTFTLESTNGSMYLLDTSKLEQLSLEGDTIHPQEVAGLISAAPTSAATAADITALKATLDSSKVTLDNANAAVTTAQTAVTIAQTAVTTALTNSTSLRANATNLLNQIIPTLMKWYNAPGRPYSMLMEYINTCKAFVLADAQAKAASVTLINAKANLVTVTATLTTAKATAATAQSSYNVALTAYNSASLAVVAPPPAIVPPTAQNANTVVDIMVLYTAHATSVTQTGLSVGYTADFAKQRIAYLVTASNQAYIDSGVKLAIRLVYAESTPYTDTNSLYTALPDLMLGRNGFEGVAAKRAQYGADLVYLFRPLNAITHTVCGLAYLEKANGGISMKELGFGVISDGVSQDARPAAYCKINTFTHEIGHNMGLVHDREITPTYQRGAFPYSYAWGVTGQYGTIMSYKGPTQLMYFSTPNLATQCFGGPCGYAETNAANASDQVKSLNLTVSEMAAFYPTLTTTPVIK